MSATDSPVSLVTNSFSSYGPAVLNGLIIVSTIGGQSLIGRLTFSCPCAYPLNIYHASTFIFGPALALFVFGLLINPNTWKLIHGCCNRSRGTSHPVGTAIVYWLQIVAQSLIAPIAWLFIAFLSGNYYECMRAGDFCDISNAHQCQNGTYMSGLILGNAVATIAFDNNICADCICSLDKISSGYLQSQSQVIAWVLLIMVGFVALTIVCVVRMCDKYTYVQNCYVKIYRDEEKKLFDEISRENARQFAEKNVKTFFGAVKLSKVDWDTISALPSIKNPYILQHWMKKSQITPEEWEYTTLQRWNNKQNLTIERRSMMQARELEPIMSQRNESEHPKTS
uniref:Uncharacterized protein n=1 Tax=Acrobeloides nanus TaxID=290746 RepID=A0A914CXW5_9BILA